MIGLKPCPFCGEIDIDIDSYKDSGRVWYFAKCDECICNGPVADSIGEAVEAWNRRSDEQDN